MLEIRYFFGSYVFMKFFQLKINEKRCAHLPFHEIHSFPSYSSHKKQFPIKFSCDTTFFPICPAVGDVIPCGFPLYAAELELVLCSSESQFTILM